MGNGSEPGNRYWTFMIHGSLTDNDENAPGKEKM